MIEALEFDKWTGDINMLGGVTPYNVVERLERWLDSPHHGLADRIALLKVLHCIDAEYHPVLIDYFRNSKDRFLRGVLSRRKPKGGGETTSI